MTEKLDRNLIKSDPIAQVLTPTSTLSDKVRSDTESEVVILR